MEHMILILIVMNEVIHFLWTLMARARLPHSCDNNDDEDEVSREIEFDLTDVSIQEHKVSGFNSNCFIFRLLLVFRIL